MSKIESWLLVFVFILIFIISLLSGYMYQQKQNEKIMFNKLENEIVRLEERNKIQDDLIQSIIRNQAMSGMFDKKD